MLSTIKNLPLSGKIGAAIVSFWIFIAIFGPFLSPHSAKEIVAWDVFEPIGGEYLLGTDYIGRDVLSRLMDGARFTVFIPLLAAALACSAGTLIALYASVSHQRVDELISRFMDALISIPSKIFALVMIAAFGSSIPILLAITAVSYMPGAFRIARALAVNVANMDFVTVARTRGEGKLYLAVKEILPNILHPMLADFGLRFVFVVLLLSSLSFLGLGVQPPQADLGSLVRENISGLAEWAPAVIIPALAIATITIAVNLLIDSFRGSATYSAGDK
ncbi:ABC transporter permease [Alteromonas sp. 1_MG-2023]|uniref:ABC transporter permease n=1 Tax=Alteromonas sp. 1_MG-2023 TaxID=3062669 RepID=UPI0026E1697E|nr:ABC transporter permease [Alteromonas sp. 1_MG-2023]MDO6476118.1 ABC transporter permease [Alteromonas sp. 1_MG-2023]